MHRTYLKACELYTSYESPPLAETIDRKQTRARIVDDAYWNLPTKGAVERNMRVDAIFSV